MDHSASNYFDARRRRTLKLTLKAVFAASLVFGVINMHLHAWSSAGVIFAVGVICQVGIYLNMQSRPLAATLLLCAGVLIALTYSIYDGDGLFDPGMIGYPLFIMLGTMLMDKRAIPWLLGLSALAVSSMSYLQSIGVVHPSVNVHDVSNWLPIMIFLAATSIMVWVNQDLQEKDHQKIHAFEQEVLFSYDKIIDGWRRALELRDMDTANHSARVVELAARLAQATGLPEQQMVHFRNGAYLHDIGKIGVPDRVLLKPGPLNDEEWQMMRRHPELAHEMLETIPYFHPALDIPRYHHERWDGTGYPDHLQGEQIPLAARIFAIVDVWDALNSQRPYRSAWPEREVRAYIAAQAGKQFDPRLVETFMKIVPDRGLEESYG